MLWKDTGREEVAGSSERLVYSIMSQKTIILSLCNVHFLVSVIVLLELNTICSTE